MTSGLFSLRSSMAYGLGLFLGLLTALVDVAAPCGDDTTKVTLVLLIASAGLLGFVAPRHPWRWAPVIGLWLPLAHLLLYALSLPDTIHPNTLWAILLLVPVGLIVCLIGACGGALLRRGASLLG